MSTHTEQAVRLSAALPKADQANGLREIAKALLDEPAELRYAVVSFDVQRLVDDLATSTDTATVRILRIEPLDGVHADMARRLLDDAADERRGGIALPFTGDLEQ